MGSTTTQILAWSFGEEDQAVLDPLFYQDPKDSAALVYAAHSPSCWLLDFAVLAKPTGHNAKDEKTALAMLV